MNISLQPTVNFPGRFIYNPSFNFTSNDSKNDNGAEREILSNYSLQQSESLRIILSDDDVDDRDFFVEVMDELKLNIKLECTEDGNDLLNRLNNKDKPLPHLIFLDLNMPNKNGKECLEDIRKSSRLKNIPVIIYSTSSSPKDIEETYQKGANLYVRKPSSFNELVSMARKIIALNWNKYKPNALRSDFVFSSKTN